MIVQKKKVAYVDEKEKRESSMLVSQEEDAGSEYEEDKLYNLMRGYTSLMIAEGSDSSEDEGEKGSEDDEKEESSEAVPEEVKEAADKQSLFGLSLPDFGSRAFNERGVPLTWKASSVITPEITGTEQDKRGESKPEERVFTFPFGTIIYFSG